MSRDKSGYRRHTACAPPAATRDPERPVVALRFKRRALECIGHSWNCPCGRSGPHAGADFTVPNDVFRTDSHFQVPFNNEETGRRVLIESADGLLSPVDTSALRA